MMIDLLKVGHRSLVRSYNTLDNGTLPKPQLEPSYFKSLARFSNPLDVTWESILLEPGKGSSVVEALNL